MPRVTVAIPCHNEAEFIEDTLKSLVAQTESDLEIIVCDNASTDETPQIAADYAVRDKRISLARVEQNIGGRMNFIRAFSLGSSPYFMWAGAHDIYHADFVKKLRLLLEANEQAVLAFSDSIFIDRDGKRHASEPINEGPDFSQPTAHARFSKACWKLHRCDMLHGLMRRAKVNIQPMQDCAAAPDMALLTSMTLNGHMLRQPDLLFFRRKNRGEQTAEDVTQHLIKDGYITTQTSKEDMWSEARQAITSAVLSSLLPKAEKKLLISTLNLAYHKRFALPWRAIEEANLWETIRLKCGVNESEVAAGIEMRLMTETGPSDVVETYLLRKITSLAKENLSLKRELARYKKK